MDFAFLKDNGITGWVAIAVAAALYVGQKLLDMAKAKIDQQPAMAANRLSMQQALDQNTTALLKAVNERLTATERRLDENSKVMMEMADEQRECEHRYAVLFHQYSLVCAALEKHGIPIPDDAQRRV